jgi:hypothetical protein
MAGVGAVSHGESDVVEQTARLKESRATAAETAQPFRPWRCEGV